jgi:hypothetical protein
MGIIKDTRPRDWTYRVAFNEKDLPSLQEMVKHIRETHDLDMIERFNDNCEQFLKGDNPDFVVQPISISKTDDLVVNVGLQQCINIIQGSAARWSHILLANSGSAITPAVTDTNVNNTASGPYPFALATYGWSEAKGMKLFFGCICPQDTATSSTTVSDMGIFNALSGGTMLNHENFYNNRLTRTSSPDLTVYTSVFLFSCVIEFCPVA